NINSRRRFEKGVRWSTIGVLHEYPPSIDHRRRRAQVSARAPAPGLAARAVAQRAAHHGGFAVSAASGPRLRRLRRRLRPASLARMERRHTAPHRDREEHLRAVASRNELIESYVRSVTRRKP